MLGQRAYGRRGEVRMSTIVIHGTMAREEPWWRVSAKAGFLDALAQGMAAGGRTPPDIWMIGGRSVSQYDGLHPSWAVSHGHHPVLNAYCASDPVQVKIAGAAPETWGAPPGVAPVFDAFRVDNDPQAKAAYDNLEIPPSFGGSIAEHAALHGP